MRLRNGKAWVWIPATTIGLTLGLALSIPIANSLPSSHFGHPWMPTFLGMSIGGVFVGLLQWLAVRRKFYDLFKWILLSALGWGFGMSIPLIVDFKFHISNISPWYLRASIFSMIIGALVGAINGFSVVSMPENSDATVKENAS